MPAPAMAPAPMSTSRRDNVFLVLAGFFLTNAIVAEVIGGKLFQLPALDLGLFTFPSVILSIGILPWPIVFLATDLVNEYFGKPAVKRISFLAVAMIVYVFAVLFLARAVPTWEGSGVSEAAFREISGQSMWIIVGSIVAFLVSQLVDVSVFVFFKKRTGGALLWLRATGSTAVSQLIDTFIVQYVGLVMPGVLTVEQYLVGGASSYAYKLVIAIGITPILYLVHAAIDRYLEADPRAK
jgi:queuosine precursor transporter